MSDESSSDAESLFIMAAKVNLKILMTRIFLNLNKYKVYNHISLNHLSVPLRVVVMMRAHTIFLRKMLSQYSGGDGDSSYV